MKKFRGVCIGGEADGQIIEASTPDVSVPRRIPMPVDIPSSVPVLLPLPPFDGYLWTNLAFGNYSEYGFWRLSSLAPDLAVAKVFQAYAKSST